MANFLASLRSSAMALDALQRSASTTQNNVTNASTPGFVRQRMALQAVEFDPDNGLLGGLTTAGLVSSRDEFTEGAVRRAVSVLGASEQNSAQLSWVETAVDLNDAAGVPSALNRLYRTFTSWSLAPSSSAEKENVYAAAAALATSFNRTADAITRSADQAQQQIGTVLSGIEAIVERIRGYNVEIRQGRGADAGVDARMHSDLEELSGLVNIQAVRQEDGTMTVLAGNEGPLVVGDRSYKLSVSFDHTDPAPVYSDALPPATIKDSSGNVLNPVVTGGKLGALVKFRNESVPYYLGDSKKAGELNKLAEQIAQRVNDILAAGYPPPHEPYHLFIYGSSAVSVAHSIRVNPSLAPALLNATDPTAIPPIVNGKAQQLSALSHPSDPADTLEGLSYISYFGKISAKAGRDLSEAIQESDSRQQMVTQARNLRDEISGVSLDEEAVRLVEFQRAYQASARMVAVLDEMTQIAVNLGRG